MWISLKKLGPIGSAVFKVIGRIQKTDKQSIYKIKKIAWCLM